MASPARLVADRIRRPVAEAVSEAEEKTAAEFVPVLAATCGRYERAEDLLGMICATIAVVIAALCLPQGEGAFHLLRVAVLVIALVAGFAIGIILGVLLPVLKRPFVSRARGIRNVATRTRQVFVDRRVHETAGGTGVVVLVSLFERGGAIVADQAVRDHLPVGALEIASQRLTEAVARGDVGEALAAAISSLGDQLGDVMPRYDRESNELPDALVLLE